MDRNGDIREQIRQNQERMKAARLAGDKQTYAECNARDMWLYEQLNARTGMWEGRD